MLEDQAQPFPPQTTFPTVVNPTNDLQSLSAILQFTWCFLSEIHNFVIYRERPQMQMEGGHGNKGAPMSNSRMYRLKCRLYKASPNTGERALPDDDRDHKEL